MKTIKISKSDFNMSWNSIINFNNKLSAINEPFEIKFDYPITEIPSNLIHGTNLAKIIIPDSVIIIKSCAFSDCKLLKEIIIPDSVLKINFSAFEHCDSLTQITLPNSITTIESYSFSGCYSLKEITLPNSITQINEGAFNNCTSLTEITIPSSIKYLDYDIFFNCTSLQKITIQMSKKDFLLNVEGALNFYGEYKEKIEFIDTLSLDTLLSKNNSLESIINAIDLEH